MAFLGMRGTGDWATDERPKDWRELILYLYPNGKMPLTAITSKMSDEQANDPQFHWWTKTLAGQAGDISGIYADISMDTAYTGGSGKGTTLYVNVSEETASEFRGGHVVLLRDKDDYRVDVVAKVNDVIYNGDNSIITVTLKEEDTNSGSNDVSNADRILITGTVQAEGAAMPESVHYDPTKMYNYTQIFEAPLEMTRTAMKTDLRTEDSYKESKREALEQLGIMMEKAWIWGIRNEETGENGKPERMTGGILYFLNKYASENIDDYTLNSDYSGNTWLQGGKSWLDRQLEQIFRYGSDDKLAVCGSGALLGLNELAENYGQINIKTRQTDYGIRINEWITPFGRLNLKTHPLFSFEVTNRNSMLILEPEQLNYNYIDDVFFKEDNEYDEGGTNNVDGIKESFLAEAGMEFDHPEKMGYLNGIGEDNNA